MSSSESIFKLKDMDKGKMRLWMDVRLDRGQMKKTEEDSDSVKNVIAQECELRHKWSMYSSFDIFCFFLLFFFCFFLMDLDIKSLYSIVTSS